MSLLMPSTYRDFQKLAEEVSDRWFRDGTPLNDGISSVAVRERMNPEEVKRLLEKSNVVTTVRMLRSSNDKKATFDLAEYDSVLGKTHPTANINEPLTENSEPEKTDMVVKEARLKSDRRNAYTDLETIFGTFEHKKVASAQPANTGEVFALTKKLEELKLRKMASEVLVKDSVDYIASEFSKYNGPDFGKFASESLALHGKFCVPILDSISKYLRCKCDMEKVASYSVDDTTKLHTKMASVCKSIRELIASDGIILTTKRELEEAWDKAKRGC